MKHVKLKILAVIWLSIIVLEGVFTIILNIAIPAYFKNMAESALKYEYEYFTKLDKINKYFGVNDESEVSDDLLGEYNAELKAVEYVEQPMSNDIRYAPLEEMAVVGGSNEAKKQNGVKVNSKSVSEQIADYCRANNFEYGKTGEFRTSSADCVFLVYNSNTSSDEPANSSVMFINVQPILEYVGTMNWVLASAFVSVAAIMTVIGSILGDRIRDTQLTQQRFFQNSSHELKTPLMSIQGYAEGIKAGVLVPTKAADVIMQEGDRMTRLVEELLFISKLDADSIPLNMVETDVREVLYDSLRCVEPLLVNRAVELKPLFSSDAVNVMCDEDQLAKAFTNVLANGVRHCESRVTVTCDKHGRYAVINVADDGKGIAESDIEHVFDRFYTGKDGSTGIGLSLAQEIVQQHGGVISAANGEKGAVFKIELPLKR